VLRLAVQKAEIDSIPDKAQSECNKKLGPAVAQKEQKYRILISTHKSYKISSSHSEMNSDVIRFLLNILFLDPEGGSEKATV